MRKCENCGAPLVSNQDSPSQRCDYCGAELRSERRQPSGRHSRRKSAQRNPFDTRSEQLAPSNDAHLPTTDCIEARSFAERYKRLERLEKKFSRLSRAACREALPEIALRLVLMFVIVGTFFGLPWLWKRVSLPRSPRMLATSEQAPESSLSRERIILGRIRIQASWTDTATRFRGQVGQRVEYVCPPGTEADFGPVWGDGFSYSNDSSVCTAAVHAGRLNPRTGGVVTIEIADPSRYRRDSCRNGVLSLALDKHSSASFRFLDRAVYDFPDEPCLIMAHWHQSLDQLPVLRGGGAHALGTTVRIRCPPGGSAGPVWGTDTYTYDSSVCTAAVHAGRITFASGGVFTVRATYGQRRYVGSTRNGVTSRTLPGNRDRWRKSFVVR